MLSTPTSSIQQRRSLHRRQNSTPAIFEVPKIQPLPAMPQRHSAHRRGLSLDHGPALQSPFSDRLAVPSNLRITTTSQADSTVSITTNLGQSQPQHPMQVAQQHSTMPQPGPQVRAYQESLVPHQPSPQQLKELEEHIKSVYGANATVQVNILPSPIPTPQRTSPITPLDRIDLAPMPNFGETCEINLEPPADDPPFQFNVESESDNGYESSFYSSGAATPARSPSNSPSTHSVPTFMDSARLAPAPQITFSSSPSLMPPMSRSMTDADGFLSPRPTRPQFSPRAMSISELNLDATIEETGITSEEIQSYISEQDPATHRWTCLFPGCEKTFGRRENIRSHVQTHLGDRQYRCNHCNKCFVRQHDLKRHAKIHSGDKPYKCPCGAGFARQDALTRHRQRGMCDGAFPNAVRRQARRGRPRKPRPELEERMEKANKTRKALTYSSSLSGSSPESSVSPPQEFKDFKFKPSQFSDLQSVQTRSSEQSSSNNFSFPEEPSTSPFEKAFEKATEAQASPKSKPPPPPTNDDEDEDTFESDTLFRLTAESFTATPPMSPAPSNADDDERLVVPKGPQRNKSPKNKRTASGRTVSNPFSTPPASPKCAPQSMFGVPDLDSLPDFSMFDQSNDLFDDTMKTMAWMDSM